MTKLLLLLVAVVFVSYSPLETISKTERKSAAKFLKESEKAVLKQVKGLSEAQLKFRPAADQWSVEECMMHIAASEKMLWGMANKAINDPANPDKRKDIKWSDEDVKKNIQDRSNKVKTFAPLEPQNTGFKTTEEAAASFRTAREELISYVKGTDADLRNHVATLPVGSFDAYQLLLFIGAHSMRHMHQMEEIMAAPGFPKQ